VLGEYDKIKTKDSSGRRRIQKTSALEYLKVCKTFTRRFDSGPRLQ